LYIDWRALGVLIVLLVGIIAQQIPKVFVQMSMQIICIPRDILVWWLFETNPMNGHNAGNPCIV